RLQRLGARRGGVELGGEPQAVGAERVELGVERLLAVIRIAPPLDRGRQRVERERKTFAGRIDGAWLAHSPRIPSMSANSSIPVAGPNTRANRRPQGDENMLHR